MVFRFAERIIAYHYRRINVLLEGAVEIISGVPVVCIDGLIQMKKKLGREKDLADIALIEKVRGGPEFLCAECGGNSSG